MKFFRRFSIIVLALAMPFVALAQNDNSGKKKISIKAFNISVGYNYGGITTNPSYVDQVFSSYYGSKTNKVSTDFDNEQFNVSFDFSLEFSPKFEVDFLFAYSHNHGKFNLTYDNFTLPERYSQTTEDFFSLMPGVKYNWFVKKFGSQSSGIFKLYSKANIGICLANRYELLVGGPVANASGAFAYQVVPLGFEIGGRVCKFFLEGGYGYTGYARGGVKFTIGHTNGIKNGLSSDSWYKDYLKMK